MNRKTVSQNFAAQFPLRGKASNLYYDGKVAYSYGEHFPLAVVTTEPGGPKTVTVNGDKYSPSTNAHQSRITFELKQAGYDITVADTDTLKALARKARG